VDDVKNIGPARFQQYLRYAKAVSSAITATLSKVREELGAGTANTEARSDVRFDSPFEEDVYNRLRDRGYELRTQWASAAIASILRWWTPESWPFLSWRRMRRCSVPQRSQRSRTRHSASAFSRETRLADRADLESKLVAGSHGRDRARVRSPSSHRRVGSRSPRGHGAPPAAPEDSALAGAVATVAEHLHRCRLRSP